MNPLFKTSAIKMDKLAAAQVSLGEDPNTWPQQLISGLLERAPFLGQYAIDQKISAQDESGSFAYGYFIVSPQQVADTRTSEYSANVPQGTPAKHIRIPFIIVKRKLKPIHVFINVDEAKMYPLTQRRVEAILFDPNGATTGRSFESTGIANSLASDGMNPGNPAPAGIAKMASLCQRIGPTIPTSWKEKVASFIINDDEIGTAVYSNEVFRDCLNDIITSKTKTAASIAEDIRSNLPIDSVMIERTRDGYRVTTACTSAYMDTSFEVSSAKGIDPRLVKEADANGYAVTNTHIPVTLKPKEVHQIKTAGVYNVQLNSDKSVPALVFTPLVDMNGNTTNKLLIKTANAYTVVDRAFGTPLEEMPEDIKPTPWTTLPRGRGVFVKEAGSATTPVTIVGYAEGVNGDDVTAIVDYNGSRGRVKVAKHLPAEDGLVKVASNDWSASPAALASFIPLSGANLEVATSEKLANALANTRLRDKEVTIHHSNGVYTISGAPVEPIQEKLAFAKEPTAVFTLGLLGISPAYGKAKLAEARENTTAKLWAVRSIKTYEGQMNMAKTAALEVVQHLPDPTDMSLVKFAAALTDPTTVDTVLGLNFVSPDNMAVFIEYLPAIEEALNHICELLVASQMGVKEIPETAAVRAINSLEAITAGLELMRLKYRTDLEGE